MVTGIVVVGFDAAGAETVTVPVYVPAESPAGFADRLSDVLPDGAVVHVSEVRPLTVSHAPPLFVVTLVVPLIVAPF
jgi:hypothetical protein